MTRAAAQPKRRFRTLPPHTPARHHTVASPAPHRYGPAAGAAAAESVPVAQDMISAAINFSRLGARAFISKTASVRCARARGAEQGGPGHARAPALCPACSRGTSFGSLRTRKHHLPRSACQPRPQRTAKIYLKSTMAGQHPDQQAELRKAPRAPSGVPAPACPPGAGPAVAAGKV